MTRSSSDESSTVLQQAMAAIGTGSPRAINGPSTTAWSERCVEVPWVAALLPVEGRLLDVGWAMSPPEWLGVLLELVNRGCEVTGIDIIDPSRVRSRYPQEIVDRVLAVPVRVEDFLEAEPRDGLFDALTCVSTLEHIGFDIASPKESEDSVFVRSKTPEEANRERDPETDRKFLDAAVRLLRPGGSLFISVPAGQGAPILHQDSLGLFTYQFEYDEASWYGITQDSRFAVEAEAFFRHDAEVGWHPVDSFTKLADQTSALRPFATGCAIAHLIRR